MQQGHSFGRPSRERRHLEHLIELLAYGRSPKERLPGSLFERVGHKGQVEGADAERRAKIKAAHDKWNAGLRDAEQKAQREREETVKREQELKAAKARDAVEWRLAELDDEHRRSADRVEVERLAAVARAQAARQTIVGPRAEIAPRTDPDAPASNREAAEKPSRRQIMLVAPNAKSNQIQLTIRKLPV